MTAWGENSVAALEALADALGAKPSDVKPQKLVELNAVAPGEVVRGGTVLLVPHADAPPVPQASTSAPGTKPTVIVPAEEFVYPDRKRVFYRVLVGDTLRDIAAALRVSIDDLDRWNDVDPSARLQEGMTLQAYVPTNADLSHVAVASETDVRVLAVGSEEFFAAMEQERGFRRLTVTVRAGELTTMNDGVLGPCTTT